MLGRRFARIVEECLHRLDRGENLPDVLADYPADAEHLKPLLLVAMASRSMVLPLPSQTAHRLGRNLMLAEMDNASASPIAAGTPVLLRAKKLATRLLNAKRAQRLIQPAPSYRLAVIALVVVFGSGLIFLSASASTSPSEFFTTFSTDFQKVLAIINQSFDAFSITKTSGIEKSIQITGGGKLPSGGSGNEKVAVLLDGEDDNSSYAYVDPYQEKNKYGWDGLQDEDENTENEQALLKKEAKEEMKALKEAERETAKEAREAEKILRDEELADKLAQIKAAIEEKQEEKLIEKEEKDEEKEEEKEQEEEAELD